MDTDVTAYIDNTKAWQTGICLSLRETVHRTLPGVAEALQYGKPHFTIEGENVAALHVAAAKVSFMVFGAEGIEPVPGLLRSLGSGDRKVVDFREGESVDPEYIADLLRRVAGHD
ncbi:DUF1801 domain-containing protein [Nocardia sp. NPDC049190]|uniref:DUF1801 domain-containing protein n=1 Tax=Nocardia sp. NPDC049190 TaxID=3155650 RepID=UPI0033F2A9D5